MNNQSFKKVIYNFIINFFSFALPTVVLQFIIQPILANNLGSELNGEYLTLMSLNYFIIAITANVLNIVRMLQHKKYQESGVEGDFNRIFIFYILILLIVMPLGYFIFTREFNLIDIILYLIIAVLYLYHDYIFSEYRLKLQFNKILINNIILVIGYIIGTILFLKVIKKWQVVMITAYAMGSIYDFINTTFIRESIKKTKYYNETIKKVGSLTIANGLSSSSTYFDKLLLYPLMGGESVTIYNIASLVGKMLLMISAPLNSLMLSYLVKTDDFKNKISKKNIIFIILFSIVAYFACVFIGYPFIKFLYPKWQAEAMKLVPITVGISLITLFVNLLNTVVIRFYKSSFQIIIQSVNLLIYLVITMTMLYKFGLYGFGIGALIVAIIQLVILIYILMTKKIEKNENKE